jgi:hypothetical protein
VEVDSICYCIAKDVEGISPLIVHMYILYGLHKYLSMVQHLWDLCSGLSLASFGLLIEKANKENAEIMTSSFCVLCRSLFKMWGYGIIMWITCKYFLRIAVACCKEISVIFVNGGSLSKRKSPHH